jgi:hypothetical protein
MYSFLFEYFSTVVLAPMPSGAVWHKLSSPRGPPSSRSCTSTNAIIYDHYLVTISCLVIEVLFAVTKKYLVIEDYSLYDDIQNWS